MLQDFQKNPLVIIAFFFLLLFLFFKLGPNLPISLTSQTRGEPLTVAGTGKATAVPNIAKVSVGISESASSLTMVEDSVNRKSQALVTALKKAGVGEKEIKTTAYNISPDYDYRNSPARIVGYRANVSYEVTIKDMEKVNEVLAAATSAGANEVGGISLDVDEETKTKVLNEARTEAVIVARNSAEGLAKAAGVTLGKIINISESTGGSPFPLREAVGIGGAPEDKVEIAPGENEYSVTVSLTFDLR